MAVKNALEYAAQSQAAANRPAQENRKNTAKQTTGKSQTNTAASSKDVEKEAVQKNTGFADNLSGSSAAEGVRYDVSKRTSDVAAWYQEYVRKEQEERLGLFGITEEELPSQKEEEKNPIQEALDKAETLVESLKRMVERMREQQKKQQEQKKDSKKKLSYSYRRVSNAISTAKTTTQASNALSSASANLSSIRRKAASGEYEDREIEIALQHAYKMVRVARKKIANMESEKLQQKRNRAKENQKQQQVKMTIQKPQRQKKKKELQQLEEELKSRENQKRNGNRRDEDMDLMQADMQYLKRKIDLLKSEGVSLSPQNQQVVEDMAAAAMGFVELGMKAQAAQASQENQSAAAQAASGAATPAPEGGSFETTI